MYELCRYIFIGGLVLSVVMLIVTILIYFLLNIKSAIGDVTGSNKRKAIENILNKSADEKSKVKTKYDHSNASKSERLEAESMNTTKISAQDRFDNFEGGATAMLDTSSSETSVLSKDDAETSVLNQGSSDTTVLNQGGSETTVLNQGGSETTVLSAPTSKPQAVNQQPQVVSTDPDFKVEVDITYVHSNEVIR